MTGLYENNVVILHNVNAFGAGPGAVPKYEPVFSFADDRADVWGEAHLEVVFAFANGMPRDHWTEELASEYYRKGNRSLSVSDVVFLNGTFYLCDRFGWKNLGQQPPV